MANLEAIQARIKKLEAQAQAIKLKKTGGVIKQIRDLMAQYEITIEDVAASTGKGSAKVQVKTSQKATSAKYADPKTGATWSGRGRVPAWIANARNRDAFLVADGLGTATRSTVPAARKKATRKGPQPALYRDPVSGLTWSGFGRAPGWIATAKDRSAYLIEGSGAGGEDGGAKTVAKKGAAAKKSENDVATPAKRAKPAAKKAGAKKPTSAKKSTAAKKSTVAKKSTSAKKATTAKKGTAAKKGAATKPARSRGARPARKSRGESQSVTPAAEASAPDTAIEATSSESE
ncbi:MULTISPECIES: H-NS histone family protein [unclassified Caballeronia]|uniref:H-NS histone family protein n=1 Tax=unclassified Caballeronia TaxID=2646786 RepID=UPI001F31089B|nr:MULTISPECIES: H-NS family nucleoid-associated regulatory protein [unclassified Caballeronia]MCE4547744.1 H-NS histone family protein [Caballeronia sp. PC1]MCE4575200.1 H-NS histone family protein [Caballeronia sp. CLC5]